MEDLYCHEKQEQQQQGAHSSHEQDCLPLATTQRSVLDPNLLKDERVLEKLLALEDHYIPRCDYFKIVQQEIKPFMRRLVVTWMFEVCEESMCEEDVFPLSVNLLDRFLSVSVIRKVQLQLLGTACLFLSSKLKETNALTAERLIVYTDNSITMEELLNWEILVLNKLRWDISAIVPNDFLEYLFVRMKLPECVDLAFVRKNAQTYISLCYIDFLFSSLNAPSMIASAAVCAAFEGIRPQMGAQAPSNQQLIQMITEITGVDEDCLVQCQQRMEEVLTASLGANHTSQQAGSSNASADADAEAAATAEKTKLPFASAPNTPTDIQDVVF